MKKNISKIFKVFVFAGIANFGWCFGDLTANQKKAQSRRVATSVGELTNLLKNEIKTDKDLLETEKNIAVALTEETLNACKVISDFFDTLADIMIDRPFGKVMDCDRNTTTLAVFLKSPKYVELLKKYKSEITDLKTGAKARLLNLVSAKNVPLVDDDDAVVKKVLSEGAEASYDTVKSLAGK